MECPDLFPKPKPDFFFNHPERRWPAWKFDMEYDDLFTTLPRQFNSITLPLLDADAFSRDISELSHAAQDKQDFLRLLAERRNSRQRELMDIWLYAFHEIATSPGLLGEDNAQWAHAMHIFRSKSFDSYVRYFSGFLGPASGFMPAKGVPSLPSASASATNTSNASTPNASTLSPYFAITNTTRLLSPIAGGDSSRLPNTGHTSSTQVAIVAPSASSKEEQHQRIQRSTATSRARRHQQPPRSSGRVQKPAQYDIGGLRRSSRIKQRQQNASRAGTTAISGTRPITSRAQRGGAEKTRR